MAGTRLEELRKLKEKKDAEISLLGGALEATEPGQKPATVHLPVVKQLEPVAAVANTEVEEEPNLAAEVPKKPIAGEVPGKLRRIFSIDEDGNYEKQNVSISRDLVIEFNDLKNKVTKKRMKTSTAAMINNILKEWLIKNKEDLEKSTGFIPFNNG
jgi:hypothetical protein